MVHNVNLPYITKPKSPLTATLATKWASKKSWPYFRGLIATFSFPGRNKIKNIKLAGFNILREFRIKTKKKIFKL